MTGAAAQLLLRADGGPRIGMGHLMRCLALGQAWQDLGGRVAVMSAGLPGSLEARLDREELERLPVPGEPGSGDDARALAAEADRRKAFVVLDGYGLGPGYQALVGAAGRPVLLVADHGTPRPGAVDLLLDQNLGADPERYPDLPPSCRALLGPRFALLRREFREAASDPVERAHPPEHLLVLLGGGDDGGLGERLLAALARDPLGLRQITVVAGPAHPRREALEALLREVPAAGRVVADPDSMVPLMQEADVAVGAAGSTCWELACLGLPAVVVPVAENQRPVAAALEAHGIALAAHQGEAAGGTGAVGRLGRLAADRRAFESLQEAGMLLVDGDGALRVARALRHGAPPARDRRLVLRPATMADARRLWTWANDPEVRSVSFRSDPIPWRGHLSWLRRRLGDPATRIYVALDESGEPIGQIRFDRCDGEAELGVSLAREARAQGLGRKLIAEGAHRVFGETPARAVDAFVKVANEASKRAFLEAGFSHTGSIVREGVPCEHYRVERP